MINLETIKTDVDNELNNTGNIDYNKITDINSGMYDNHPLYLIQPIHYFFDNYINDKIGNTYNYVFNYFDILKFNEIFKIDKNNLHYVGLDKHQTIIYTFRHNDECYIYYSNSGLGSNKYQYVDINKNTTACKMYKFNDVSNDLNLLNLLCNDIIQIINVIIQKIKYNEKINTNILNNLQ